MVEGKVPEGATIDELLRDRSKYQQWLAKLDAAGDGGAPQAVRSRVRTDYEGRLRAVLDRLRTHVGAITDALAKQRATLEELEAKDIQVAEQLAEASLRHAVGEYEEGEWQRISAEAGSQREAMAHDMESTRREIDRLSEVQAIILEAPKPEPEAAAPPAAAPAPAAAAVSTATAPKAAAPKPMDELDFLKSVTDEAPAAPKARPAAAQSQPRAATTAQAEKAKTLKCQECGTENKPSEWYCERCGAELTEL